MNDKYDEGFKQLIRNLRLIDEMTCPTCKESCNSKREAYIHCYKLGKLNNAYVGE